MQEKVINKINSDFSNSSAKSSVGAVSVQFGAIFTQNLSYFYS